MQTTLQIYYQIALLPFSLKLVVSLLVGGDVVVVVEVGEGDVVDDDVVDGDLLMYKQHCKFIMMAMMLLAIMMAMIMVMAMM